MPGAFAGVIVLTRAWAALIAFAAIVLLLAVAHVLIVGAQKPDTPKDMVRKRRRGVKALVIGADGRASTSKLQVVMWTFSVFFAFVFLLVWGRNLGCGPDESKPGRVKACEQAARDRTTFSQVGKEIQPDYYVLLGFPLGVAVAARALITSKVAAGTVTKTENQQPGSVIQGLRETISNDQGETDLVDFQYFAFNLVALAFFWVEFLTKPALGLPDLPATLIALSGLSAAAYTARKAVQTDVKPGVSTVIPRRISLNGENRSLSIIGSGFGERKVLESADDKASPPAWVAPAAWVRIDGVSLRITSWRSARIDAILAPADYVAQNPGVGEEPKAAQLVVDVSDGQPSDPFDIEVHRVHGGRQA